MDRVFAGSMPCFKALYSGFTGLSPAIAHEICYRAGGMRIFPPPPLDEAGRKALYRAFLEMMGMFAAGLFSLHRV